MLIIGQPDKMLRDLRNIKESTELSAMSMWIVGSGDNHVSNFVFSICKSECLAKVGDMARSLLHCTHRSHFLLKSSYHFFTRLSGI